MAIRGPQAYGQRTHLVSLVQHGSARVLAQTAVAKKRNEIMAAPHLLHAYRRMTKGASTGCTICDYGTSVRSTKPRSQLVRVTRTRMRSPRSRLASARTSRPSTGGWLSRAQTP